MREIQDKIRTFLKEHNMESPAEYHVLDAMSEMGEVAKELCKQSNYGREPLRVEEITDAQRAEMKSELGDMMFCLVKLANVYDIDLEEALALVLAKYEKRLAKGGAGSENE